MVRRDSECLAAFVGVEFGNRIYYLVGGTKSNRDGAGSFLMLNIIKYLYENHQDGELLLGFCRGIVPPKDYEDGILLYRRKLRAEAVSGVYETFVYQEAAATQHRWQRWSSGRFLMRWVVIAAASAIGAVAPAIVYLH